MKERVKDLCKQKGISMNFAEMEIGLAKGYISKLDKSNPNAKTLQKIADYFGVSVEFLIHGEDSENKYYINDETAQLAQALFENKDLRVLFDAAKDASPEDLQTTYDMLMALKKKERGIID